MCKVQAALMLDVPGCYGGWVEQSFDMFAIWPLKRRELQLQRRVKPKRKIRPRTNRHSYSVNQKLLSHESLQLASRSYQCGRNSREKSCTMNRIDMPNRHCLWCQ